jgi:hypothetical protein
MKVVRSEAERGEGLRRLKDVAGEGRMSLVEERLEHVGGVVLPWCRRRPVLGSRGLANRLSAVFERWMGQKLVVDRIKFED